MRRLLLSIVWLLAANCLAGCSDWQPNESRSDASSPTVRPRTDSAAKPDARKRLSVPPTRRNSPGLLSLEQAAARLAWRDAGGPREVAESINGLLADAAEQGPVLAVWLLDRSASARLTLSDVAQDLTRAMVASPERSSPSGSAGDAPRVLHAAATIGGRTTFILDPPAADVRALAAAFQAAPSDDSGRENTFTAIGEAVERYLPWRTEQQREVLLFVLTDEAGDDAERVDEVLETPRRYGIPIYAIGVPAPLGRVAALPDTAERSAASEVPAGEVPAGWKPIRQGPESRELERLQLGFWGGSTDLELLDSGFGPFALERLCRATGGCFFSLRVTPYGAALPAGGVSWPPAAGHRFDPQIMQRYRPDYVSRQDYDRLLAENRARQALYEAARQPYLPLMEFPQFEFAARSEAELAQQLSRAQQIAARMEPPLAKLYELLEAGEADRDSLSGPRWQAAFDLALGRSAASKARVEGYNAMLAALKRGKSFTDPASQRWVLEPSDQFEGNSALERVAEKARRSLTRVTVDHPGTPWAMIAHRESQTPLGWRWTER